VGRAAGMTGRARRQGSRPRSDVAETAPTDSLGFTLQDRFQSVEV